MPLAVEIEVKGLKEIQEATRKFPEKAQRYFGRAVKLAADDLAHRVRDSQYTPVDTGTMINKTGSRVVNTWAAMMFVATKYAAVVHQGIPTDIQLPRAINVFIKGVGWRRLTKIKARPPKPFVDHALKNGGQKRIDDIMATALKLTVSD